MINFVLLTETQTSINFASSYMYRQQFRYQGNGDNNDSDDIIYSLDQVIELHDQLNDFGVEKTDQYLYSLFYYHPDWDVIQTVVEPIWSKIKFNPQIIQSYYYIQLIPLYSLTDWNILKTNPIFSDIRLRTAMLRHLYNTNCNISDFILNLDDDLYIFKYLYLNVRIHYSIDNNKLYVKGCPFEPHRLLPNLLTYYQDKCHNIKVAVAIFILTDDSAITNINLNNQDEYYFLDMAVRSQSSKCVSILLNRNSSLIIDNTLLNTCCRYSNELILTILMNKVNNIRDIDPLLTCIRHQQNDCFHIIYQRMPMMSPETIYNLANQCCRYNNVDIFASICLEIPNKINELLTLSIEQRSCDVIRYILSHHTAEINNFTIYTLLYQNHIDIIELAIQKLADHQFSWNDVSQSIRRSILKEDRIFFLLYNRFKDYLTNHTEINHWLESAAEQGKLNIIQTLMYDNIPIKILYQCLKNAVMHSHNNIATYLLQYNLDCNQDRYFLLRQSLKTENHLLIDVFIQKYQQKNRIDGNSMVSEGAPPS
jgi:hypothetical protein